MPPGRNNIGWTEEPLFSLQDQSNLESSQRWKAAEQVIKDERRNRIPGLLFNLPYSQKKYCEFPAKNDKQKGWYHALEFLFSEHDIKKYDDETRHHGIDRDSFRGNVPVDVPDHYFWEPVTQIGEGAYGKVGIWQKVDSRDRSVVDEIAIKQQWLEPLDPRSLSDRMKGDYVGRGIDWEAIVMTGLQQKDTTILEEQKRQPSTFGRDSLYPDRDRHVLRIRQYKHNPSAKHCRMYLEYCPHGTLGDLVSDYRAYNQNLPIAFLWHVFHSLALAIHQMNDRLKDDAFLYECRRLRKEPDWPAPTKHYFIHRDIKPGNILLGYSIEEHDEADGITHIKGVQNTGAAEDRSDRFPSVKLADFGTAMLTTSEDPCNPPPKGKGGGTPNYYPPEQSQWLSDYKNAPNKHGPPDQKGNPTRDRWTAAHMVYQVGKVVWDAMQHSKSGKMTDKQEDMNMEKYIAKGHHFLEASDVEEGSPTDKDMIDLLLKCMTPEARQRPDTGSLVEITRKGLRRAMNGWVQKDAADTGRDASSKKPDKVHLRLFFKDREIEDMPLGNRRCGPTEETYLDVRYRDPRHPVELPAEKWYDQQDDEAMFLWKLSRKSLLPAHLLTDNEELRKQMGNIDPSTMDQEEEIGGGENLADLVLGETTGTRLVREHREKEEQRVRETEEERLRDEGEKRLRAENEQLQRAAEKQLRANEEEEAERLKAEQAVQETRRKNRRVIHSSSSPEGPNAAISPKEIGVPNNNVPSNTNHAPEDNDNNGPPNTDQAPNNTDPAPNIDIQDSTLSDSLTNLVDPFTSAETTQTYLSRNYIDLQQLMKSRNLKFTGSEARTKATMARKLRDKDDADRAAGPKRRRRNVEQAAAPVQRAPVRRRGADAQVVGGRDAGALSPRRTRRGTVLGG